jgi:hypothetical protein
MAVLFAALLLAIMAFPGCAEKTASQNVSTQAPVTAPEISAKEKQDLIDRTIHYQTEGDVYHADSYEVVKLKKGDIIYGMLPGQSVFYTDEATLKAGDGSYQTMYRLLQIRPHPVYGYRTNVGKYELLEDAYMTAGVCRANRQITVDGKAENLGDGGGYQYVVFDFSNKLKLLEEITLHE